MPGISFKPHAASEILIEKKNSGMTDRFDLEEKIPLLAQTEYIAPESQRSPSPSGTRHNILTTTVTIPIQRSLFDSARTQPAGRCWFSATDIVIFLLAAPASLANTLNATISWSARTSIQQFSDFTVLWREMNHGQQLAACITLPVSFNLNQQQGQWALPKMMTLLREFRAALANLLHGTAGARQQFFLLCLALLLAHGAALSQTEICAETLDFIPGFVEIAELTTQLCYSASRIIGMIDLSRLAYRLLFDTAHLKRKRYLDRLTSLPAEEMAQLNQLITEKHISFASEDGMTDFIHLINEEYAAHSNHPAWTGAQQSMSSWLQKIISGTLSGNALLSFYIFTKKTSQAFDHLAARISGNPAKKLSANNQKIAEILAGVFGPVNTVFYVMCGLLLPEQLAQSFQYAPWRTLFYLASAAFGSTNSLTVARGMPGIIPFLPDTASELLFYLSVTLTNLFPLLKKNNESHLGTIRKASDSGKLEQPARWGINYLATYHDDPEKITAEQRSLLLHEEISGAWINCSLFGQRRNMTGEAEQIHGEPSQPGHHLPTSQSP